MVVWIERAGYIRKSYKKRQILKGICINKRKSTKYTPKTKFTYLQRISGFKFQTELLLMMKISILHEIAPWLVHENCIFFFYKKEKKKKKKKEKDQPLLPYRFCGRNIFSFVENLNLIFCQLWAVKTN